MRADIAGKEARLGSADFCGIADAAHAPHGSDASFITFTHDGAAVTIPIRQTLRPDAVAVIDALRKRGLDLIILSGDRPDAVAPIAKGLGIANWQAGLKPAEKIAKKHCVRMRLGQVRSRDRRDRDMRSRQRRGVVQSVADH